MTKTINSSRYRGIAIALVASTIISGLLFSIRIFGADNFRFSFIFWNLLLAAIPLLLAISLVRQLRQRRWFAWQNLLLTILWLLFLPNSFYLATDLIHIHLTGEINILFDIVLFMSCIFNAYLFGFMSLYLVHRQLLNRIDRIRAHTTIALVLFMCGFAIYLGRYLRWNTWDIFAHPLGLLFDISDRLINPGSYPQAIITTGSFFLLLASMYWVIWELVKLLRSQRS